MVLIIRRRWQRLGKILDLLRSRKNRLRLNITHIASLRLVNRQAVNGLGMKPKTGIPVAH